MWKWSKEDCGNSLSNNRKHQPQWIATVCDRVLKRSNNQGSLESRMQGNLHVRFGVGAGERSPAYTTRGSAYWIARPAGLFGNTCRSAACSEPCNSMAVSKAA